MMFGQGATETPTPFSHSTRKQTTMSHEIDFSNDRANIAYTGEVPWHGFGQAISPDDNLETWRTAAGLDWEAKRAPAMYEAEGSDGPAYAGEDVIYRSDTRAKLGIVSPGYQLVQPEQVLEFFRHYVEELGAFEMHTVGALREGRRIWALAKSKDGLFSVGDDTVNRYLLLATSFDRSMATIVQQTSIRVVCNNTLTAAYMQGSKKVDPTIRVSHHGTFSGSKVRERMKFEEQWQCFVKSVGRWASRRVSRDEQDQFFRDVLQLKAPSELDDKGHKSQKKKLEELDAVFRKAPGQQLESASGTVWGLVNAVTFIVDHTMGKTNDTRMDQAWFGQRRQMKDRAMKAAERLAA